MALSMVLGGFSAQAAALKVLATTNLVADLVQSIGGDRVAMTSLMGPGVDPHLYKPTAGDIIKLTRAEVVFYHGMALEGKMGDLFARLSRQGRSIHAITQNLPPKEWIVPEESPQHPDPHVWGDPRLWKNCAQKVQQVLVQLNPDGKDLYIAANQQYAQRLEEWMASTTSVGPLASRLWESKAYQPPRKLPWQTSFMWWISFVSRESPPFLLNPACHLPSFAGSAKMLAYRWEESFFPMRLAHWARKVLLKVARGI